MRIKIEQALLMCGIATSILMLFIPLSGSRLLVDFFRGGTFGGMLVGVFLLAGLLGCFFYFINVISGKRQKWALRLSTCFVLFLLLSIVSTFY